MEPARAAPLAGIGACLALVAALAYPFAVADAGVWAYYASGVVNPLVGGLLALVAVVVFAAGREDRTDPSFAAGVALVFGVFVGIIVFAWAFTARVDAAAVAASHRWLVVAFGVAIPAAGLWYARALHLV